MGKYRKPRLLKCTTFLSFPLTLEICQHLWVYKTIHIVVKTTNCAVGPSNILTTHGMQQALFNIYTISINTCTSPTSRIQ